MPDEGSQMTRISTGRTETAGRPIHRACVVTGCPCQPGDAIAGRAARGGAASKRSTNRVTGSTSVDVAWRTVGLPIV
jgi:hypothetical protein